MSKNENFNAAQRLVAISDTAYRLSCSERQVWRLLRKSELERVCIGGMTRTTEESIQKLINRNKK